MFDQYKPALIHFGRECESRYDAMMRRLGDIVDAVRDSNDDPTNTDIFIRYSAVGQNGDSIIGRVPPGELWVVDFVSASANTWTVRLPAFGVVFGAQPTVLGKPPVFLPGDEIHLLTTGATDVFIQFTRRPLADRLPRKAASGAGKDNVSGQSGNPQHEQRTPVLAS